MFTNFTTLQRKHKLMAIQAASVLFVAGLATPATAEEIQCTGSIGATTLDNIFVPDGATCQLDGTIAKGSIVVGTSSTLIANRVSVNGNVQAEGANNVVLKGRSSVGGSVQIVQGYAASVEHTRINGDLYYDTNRAPLKAANNNVGGNLQVFQNTGGAEISNNFIKGNLQCKENTPAPTGGGNRASSKEDQCARL
jgi:hypothetical protein